mgnify:CR=1 FL=1
MNYLSVSFNIFGLNISLYGLLMAVGFIVAFIVCNSLFKKSGGFSKDVTIDLLLLIFPLSILGARIYYCVFSAESFTFIEFLQVWNGGLAIYGGIIGGFLGVVIYAIIKKINILKLTDVIAVGLILAQSIGRIGCYFGGCCYGIEVTNPSLCWFPLSVLIDGHWHLSTFFYEAIWNFIGFIILFFVYNKTKQTGVTTGAYLAFYGLGRCVIEAFRGDSLYIGSIKVSQLLSGILMLVGAGLIVYSIIKSKKVKNEQKQIS